VLREPQPESGALFETAMGHYARGLAFTRKRQPVEAEAEAARLAKVAPDKALAALETPEFPGASVVRLARAILTAELAGLRGETEPRLRGLEEAVRLQDKLPYMEPPFWYFPIRQLHGAALVQASRFAEAEAVYREDLKRHPENGWSLFGLLQALRSQGKTDAAADTARRFRDAWKYSDVTLTASCF
jgi:tetratricopeptide (TPR) repeat protein